MKKISIGFGLLLTASLGAHMANATPVTYSFTGYVTVAQGTFASFNGQSVLGDTVTGTYTFNYDAAIPSQSSGTPGSSSWSSTSGFPGNFPQGASLSDTLVFTSTTQVVGTNISYATSPPSGTGFNISANAQGSNENAISGSEQANQANGGDTQSSFQIASNFTPGSYDSNGGPVYLSSLPPGAAFGDFAVTTGGVDTGVIQYYITSISPPAPVPLPAMGWLYGGGVMGLAGLARRRQSA